MPHTSEKGLAILFWLFVSLLHDTFLVKPSKIFALLGFVIGSPIFAMAFAFATREQLRESLEDVLDDHSMNPRIERRVRKLLT